MASFYSLTSPHAYVSHLLRCIFSVVSMLHLLFQSCIAFVVGLWEIPQCCPVWPVPAVQRPAEVTCIHFSNIKISLERIGKQI